MKQLSRQQFLQIATLGGSAIFLNPPSKAQTSQERVRPPALKPELVKEFVIAGHSNLEKTQTMLAAEPGLLNVCWDWGGGDFETALEGAGHVGTKEVALFLLSQGARINVFCAAMLGQLEIVKHVLALKPALKESKGPHGLQLIHHAKKGGEEAKQVLEYLQSINAK
ncbi:MAG: ankyrin repeat protein [Chitinophagaceae bacterium]|nr:ankyrin repeat protein [Chitinophagaceae bacterium]